MTTEFSSTLPINLDALDQAATRMDIDAGFNVVMGPVNDTMAEVRKQMEAEGLTPNGTYKMVVTFSAEAT